MMQTKLISIIHNIKVIPGVIGCAILRSKVMQDVLLLAGEPLPVGLHVRNHELLAHVRDKQLAL